MAQAIRTEKQDGVARVLLVHPTMTPAFFDELDQTFTDLAGDSELRAVVLAATGKAFSYGLDLKEAFQRHGRLFAGGTAAQRTELLALIRQWQGAFDKVAACPVPTIAAVHGWCIGGGLDLISACDVRLATADAKFSLREARIAIVADLGSLQRLEGIIGRGHLREMAFTAGDVTADRAFRIGLANDVYPDRDALIAAADAMAARIASNPPLVIRGTKDILRFGEGHRQTDGLRYVAAWNAAFLASEDLGEAVAAFMGGREPSYKGR
jgi:enoyl-CoA hydratase